MVVSVLLLLVSSSFGHIYLPFTRRCPAIRVPQLWHWGLFLEEGGVPDIVVVVDCVAENSESL